MAITLPPDLASIFAAISGMEWPQANEDDLRTAGDDYQTIADDIPKLKEYIVEIVNICLDRFEGEAADAFVASMRELIGQTGGTDYLGEAAKQAGELAGVAHDTANQVEYTKWMVIGQLIMLVAEILFDIFWAPFTFGESLLNITWEWALVREAIQIIFKWLLKSIAMHTFTSVAQSLLLDGVIQGVQFAQGHRHQWDEKATLQAFEFGLITGVVSGPLDLVGMGLGKMIGGAIGKSAGSIVGHELGGAMKDTLGHAGKGVLEGGISTAGKWLDDTGSKAFARDVGNVMGAALPQIRQGFTKFGEGTIAEAFENRFARIFERHLGPVLGEETAEKLGRDFGRTFAQEWRGADAEVTASLRRLLHETPVSDTGVRALADTLPELAQHMKEGNTMFMVGHAIGEQLKEGALNNLSEGFYNLIFSDSHQFTSTWATFGSGVAMGVLGRVGHHLASPVSARFADYVANWQHAPIHEGDSRYFGPLHPLTVLSLASNLAGHPAPFPVPRLGPHSAEASGGPVGDTMKTSSSAPDRHGSDSEKEPLLGSGASVRTEGGLDSRRTSISSEASDIFRPYETVGGHDAAGGHEGVEPEKSIGPPEAVRTHSGDDTATATTGTTVTHPAASDRTAEPPPGSPTPRPTQSDDGPAPVPHEHTSDPSPVPHHTVPAPHHTDPAPQHADPAPQHAETPRVDLPAGVWFPRAHSTPRHETAARAVPGADGWRLVVGHGSPGRVEIGGVPVDAETALTHIGTGDKLTFATCYAAEPDADGHSLAMDTHLRTGKETLGPTHEAIVTAGGEVISGVFGIDRAGRPVVMPTGDWVVFRDGVPHSLQTSSLSEAYAKLGAEEKAGGPAPDEAVGFVYGISAAQRQGLAQYGYAAADYPHLGRNWPDPGRADSFFTSLQSMAAHHLRPYLGNHPSTPERIRQAMHAALQADLNGTDSRYERFLTPGQDVNQLLATLNDPAQWTPQLGEIAPHLAADLFNLRLGVVGASGRPEIVGQVMGRTRAGHADGNPYLLVRVGDNHFVPTVRTGGPAPAVPRAEQVHGLPGTSGHDTWTRQLTSAERTLVDQAGEDALRHPAVEPRVGPGAIVAHAQTTAAHLRDAITDPNGALATNLRDQLHDLIERALTGNPLAIVRLDAVERVAHHHEMRTTGGPMDEAAHIRRIQQAGTAEGTPISTGDARTAARAHAYHELGSWVRNALTVPSPAGTGVRDRLGAAAASARQDMDAAGTRARQDAVTAARNAVPPARIAPGTPAEARAAAMAVHQRRIDQSERDAKRAGGPADQAERGARQAVLRQHVGYYYSPREFDRMRWALLANSVPNHITHAERAGVDAATAVLDVFRDPAREMAEWEIRSSAERHEQLAADPPRQLPAGFGERDGDGRRQYPLGYRGRLMRLGTDWFGDDTAIANLVSGHAPADTDVGLRNAINDAVRERLTGLGNRAVAQRMLEGGLRFSVTSGGERHDVRVMLHLGEPPRAHYLPAFESRRDEGNAPAAQQTPLGQKHHGAVESDHERIAGTRKGGSTNRSLAVNVSLTSPFGVQPARIFSGGAEFGLDADSGKGWSYGNDGVSATKRFLDVAGKESHFDFPYARLTVQLRRGAADTDLRTHTATLPARFGFPKELTPHQPAGGGPVLPDPAARRGAGNPFHGVTPAQLHAGAVAAPDTADRVHDVLGTVLHIPESISGLGTLRDQLLANLPHPVETGSDLYDGIQHWISEPNLLRNYGELTTIGTLSPAYRTGDGDTSAYLTVTSKMLGAQRVGDDPVPMKEESQRWVNTNSGSSESGSFGISPVKGNIGYTIGDPTASFGFNHSLGAGGGFGAKLSTTRSSNENTGAGEVRGLVYDGPSVLYRLTTRMAVTVTSDADGYANDDRPLATRDVTTFARIPVHEAPRFEALIDRETAGPGDSQPWLNANGQVPRDRDPRPADPTARDNMVAAERTRHYPPTSIESGQGIGFSAIGRLSGSEKVIPEIEATLRKVEYSRTWIPDRPPMEQKYLRHQLLAKFSKEALINRGSALFQPGGVKERLHRAVDGGTEVITVTVKAKKIGTIPVAGRVASTKLELMPAGFAGEGGADSLSSTLSGNGNLGFTAGIGSATGDRLRQFGFSLEGSGGSGKSASTSVGASGFQIQAMLYNGPGRTFDFDVRYEVTVGVRYRPKPSGPGDWPKMLYNWVRGPGSTPDPVMAAAARNQYVTAGEARMTSTLQGGERAPYQVRFVVPENLAPTTRAHHPNAGHLTKYDYPIPPPRPGNRYNGGKPTITLPDLPRVLKDAHAPLNGDDIVMETIGSEHLEKEVGELLSRVGVDPDKTGDITWVVTGTEMLTGAQVRGPSSITATMVGQGIIKDENTVIRIEGFPVSSVQTPQDLTTLRMDVAEGGANVSGSHGSSTDSGYKASVNFGALAGEHDGSQQVFPGLNRAGDIPGLPRSASSRTTALGPVSGRLTQVTEPYRQHRADMAYRITVVNQAKNMVTSDVPRVAGSVIKVTHGIHYLRSNAAHVDPHAPNISGATDEAPGNRPTLIRTALDPDGSMNVPRQRRDDTDKIIPTFAATPHDLDAGADGRRLPVDGLVPHAAASERLLVRPTAGPHFDVTGEGNPILAGVQRLLQKHAPSALEDYWQIVGTSAKLRPVPTKLSNLLNVGSAEALIDTMLGPGLILHTTESGFLHNNRLWVLLRAHRDPGNNGYYYLENVPQANVARYHFRTNRSETGRSRPRGFEWSSGTKAGENPANAGRFSSGSVNPSASVGHSSSEGSAVAKVDASRNTLFVGGNADRYAGDLRIDMVVVTTPNPSRLLNTTLFTLPDKVSMVLHDKLDMAKVDGRESTMLTERVLIPRQLLRPDIQVYTPHPRHVAVSEVPFGSTPASLGGVPLRVTGRQLMDRSVFNLGLDPDKLQVLSDEVFKRLGGNVPTLDHSFDSATARMAGHGSRARDAIYTMLSAPMMTNELEFMVGPDGIVSPPLVREGGPFTDTHAKVTIKAALFDPRIKNYFTGGLESNSYHFVESNKNKSDGDSWGLGNSTGFSAVSGSTAPQPPGSHAAQKPSGGLSFGVKQATSDSSFVVHKDMPRVLSRNRNEPWLRVKTDVLLKITVEARNQRGPLDFPGGTTQMAFRIRNGVELAFSPDHALRTFDVPALHANGVPTPSGVLIPAKGFAGVHDDGMAQLQAAFTFPAIDNSVVIHVHGDPGVPGNFVVGGRSMTPDRFAREVLDRHHPRAGQYLVFVGCRVNLPIGGGPSAAQIIAQRYPGVRVIGTQGVALTTSSGSVLTGVFTGNGLRPGVVGWKGDWIMTEAPLGQPANVVHLGHDLVAALRARGLNVGAAPGGSPPPTHPLIWGGGSSGTPVAGGTGDGAGGDGGGDRTAPGDGEDPLVMPPSDWTSVFGGTPGDD